LQLAPADQNIGKLIQIALVRSNLNIYTAGIVICKWKEEQGNLADLHSSVPF
jgi:hypothetical protein